MGKTPAKYDFGYLTWWDAAKATEPWPFIWDRVVNVAVGAFAWVATWLGSLFVPALSGLEWWMASTAVVSSFLTEWVFRIRFGRVEDMREAVGRLYSENEVLKAPLPELDVEIVANHVSANLIRNPFGFGDAAFLTFVGLRVVKRDSGAASVEATIRLHMKDRKRSMLGDVLSSVPEFRDVLVGEEEWGLAIRPADRIGTPFALNEQNNYTVTGLVTFHVDDTLLGLMGGWENVVDHVDLILRDCRTDRTASKRFSPLYWSDAPDLQDSYFGAPAERERKMGSLRPTKRPTARPSGDDT